MVKIFQAGAKTCVKSRLVVPKIRRVHLPSLNNYQQRLQRLANCQIFDRLTYFGLAILEAPNPTYKTYKLGCASYKLGCTAYSWVAFASS